MNWTIDSIQELINTEAEETNTLEFKSADSLHNALKGQEKRKEIMKDISAMANSNGGTIIYGIQECQTDKKGNAGKAESLSPVDCQIVSKEWLEQIIHSNIAPKIEGLQIIKIPIENNTCLFVLEIPQSNTAHQAPDKKYYKRYNFLATPMDDWEIKDIINRQSKPDIEISFNIFKEKGILGMPMPTGNFNIEIKLNNKSKIGANYINCFIEIPKEAGVFIRTPQLIPFNNVYQLFFTNKEDTVFSIGKTAITLPGVFNPLLPNVIRTIGVFSATPQFFSKDFSFKCMVATESSFIEREFSSSSLLKID